MIIRGLDYRYGSVREHEKFAQTLRNQWPGLAADGAAT
jgi:hypothetical protein